MSEGSHEACDSARPLLEHIPLRLRQPVVNRLEVEPADVRRPLQESNREEVTLLEGPARERLAGIVGEAMAMGRLASARGRQPALDSGDVIPSHLSARKPG